MTERKRLFVGVTVSFSDKTADFYQSIKDHLNESSIRFVGIDNIHITLKFLGDVEISRIPSIETKLNILAKKHNEFNALLKGVGIFKNFYHPKVLWFGLRDCPEFDVLKNDIENSLGDLGFDIDYRKFTPHLTVGRFKEKVDVEQLKKFISRNQEIFLQPVPVSEISLFESILKNEGPEYNILQNVRLGDTEFNEYRF